MVRTLCLTILVSFIVAAVLGPEAAAQSMTPAQARARASEAGGQVFDATAAIFTCLSEGRRGKPVAYEFGDAKKALAAAKARYLELAAARQNTRFSPDDYTQEAYMIIEGISTTIAKGGIRTEADVANANISAIDRLSVQIDKWKDCSPTTIHTAEFLAFIENKIMLERTTQLAEIAWIKSR